jgi:FkbM family methyltransferase
MTTTTEQLLIFDHSHYIELIESRGSFLRRILPELKSALDLNTAVDAGCGIGFFSALLREYGLSVQGFDGRASNIDEARRRYPEISFQVGDIEDSRIVDFGSFDLVLCFGLLYHLESPMRAIRHLRALSGKALLLESMCLAADGLKLVLREEPDLIDQSLTDLALYASETCLVKMLYRAGFRFVYGIAPLPDHDDFRETPDHARRRTVLFASPTPVEAPGFTLFPEPHEIRDPWSKSRSMYERLWHRVARFLTRPTSEKVLSVGMRLRKIVPSTPIPVCVSFGAWWLAARSALDYELLTNGFENSELRFVEGFLRPGMTVLDIGAHHGLYTLLSSKRVGLTGRVIAFEPSPRERIRLQRHLRLNRCDNVRVEDCALGREIGDAELFLVDGAEDWCNSLRPPVTASPTAQVSVKVRQLDCFVADAGIKKVDFIKLDVEGAELDVLRGANSLLHGSWRPVILVEVYDIRTRPWGYAANEIVRFLKNVNYCFFTVLKGGTLRAVSAELDSYDTNLVAVPLERLGEVMAAPEGESKNRA